MLAGCRQAPQPLPPLVAQLSGSFEVDGVSAPVRIVRDRWGVPHIYAQSRDDLFIAQGFVQAQDRLFQMDLWRRSAQGRLSEVLGPNFIERDAMTRRIQYRGDPDVEWASYGPDTRAIAAAFVRGINAWVAAARERPPEEFLLAGWKPSFWSPTDLLNRTDAFVASGDAIDEVRRRRFSDVIVEAIRRVGAKPFFAGLAADVPTGGTNPVSTASSARNGSAGETAVRSPSQARMDAGVLVVSEAGAFVNPSPRYLVHLHAPGWNVIGATAPWRPGVAIGHNERIAWGLAPFDVDTQDVVVGSPGDEAARSVVHDVVVVKRRRVPFAFETEITADGIVIASDRERNQTFSIRWSGTEPGAAPELGALALDTARNWPEFRSALARWKMPARRVVYADADGNDGFQDAALVPVRRQGKRGVEWRGWQTIDDLSHAFNPPDGVEVARATSNAVTADRVVFSHILAINDRARARYNVGPVTRTRGDDAALRLAFDPRNWDKSRAILAPGQSESPTSSFFGDLTALWSRDEFFTLAFSDEVIRSNAKATLTLAPKSIRPPSR